MTEHNRQPRALLRAWPASLALSLLGVGCAPAVAGPGLATPVAPGGSAAPAESAPPADSAAPAESAATQPSPAPQPGAAKAAPPQALTATLQPVWQATCPAEMTAVTRIKASFCVDRFEGSLERVTQGGRSPWPHNESIDGREREFVAVSVKGRRPQGYISGDQAAKVCGAAGKRLCANDEWVTACRGPEVTKYPYGNKRTANTCNNRFKVLDHHPVPRLWKKDPTGDEAIKMWHPSFMNDKRLLLFDHTTLPTGQLEGCTNAYGVYDMVGNLHEWVADSDGTFMGGFFMDTYQNGEGCGYRTIGHGSEYHDYSTGFRCCADATWKETSR